mmetsp:Transcript_42584/g.62662  ORF Transcript_42584/g.62662 Transcript_42584/m.62662 type:complete len:335 (+) Transcript_42584:173-1177(+)|eukprot:CAMPEP_0173086136 /NCGR_PEP_ID=MMETSP1102-20130122/22472_1 /TAXON_ID=49646 /ORGANISM="Geminigera sp., Strain Caron Lab Isolate" /LENGTH=334 /DNA_ID=CAMNT_0013966417 /DNA_START=159 /DNA_END=1163 /DNA_ORIENTATION=-
MPRCWRLRSRPEGSIKDTDLEMCEEPKPTPEDGQLLVKNLFISIDPTHRIWMSDIPQYMPKVELGEVMRASTVGVVEESKDPNFAVGCHVFGFGGCADYYVGIPGANVMYKAGETGTDLPLTADLSVCSVTIGLTAWHGTNKILDPGPNDIVVISGAAGAVGSLVGQLCKRKGAKVVGIAGSPAKCTYLKSELGYDCVINYKTQDVAKELAAFAPDGISGYFDNVGGDVTDAVLLNARNNCKIAICGSISEYDNKEWAGQKKWNMILMRRISIKGFIGFDHMDEMAEAKAELAMLASEGKIRYSEDIREGLETYPATVRLLMSGHNTGKLILKI